MTAIQNFVNIKPATPRVTTKTLNEKSPSSGLDPDRPNLKPVAEIDGTGRAVGVARLSPARATAEGQEMEEQLNSLAAGGLRPWPFVGGSREAVRLMSLIEKRFEKLTIWTLVLDLRVETMPRKLLPG
jgi:hypothetical protein